jgi:pimeloyl-ACP methyl ester carboxylesterase
MKADQKAMSAAAEQREARGPLPALVMIHGMWGRPAVWENFRQRFSQAGFEIHTPALRHHDTESGNSGGEPGTTSLADYRSDLEEILRHFDRPPILMGHSLGALLAQQLASQGLASALILLAPGLPFGQGALQLSTIRILRRLYFRRRFWARAHRLGPKQAAYGLFHRLPPVEQDRQIAAMSYDSGRVLFELALPAFDRRRVARTDIDRVSCPVMIVAGAQDRMVPVGGLRRLSARYGDRARYLELPEHAHWLMGEPGWAEIAGACLGWLDDVRFPAA